MIDPLSVFVGLFAGGFIGAIFVLARYAVQMHQIADEKVGLRRENLRLTEENTRLSREYIKLHTRDKRGRFVKVED